MVKYQTWLQFAVLLIFIIAVGSLVRSCQYGPAQTQLFDRLSMMRSDMNAVVGGGRRIVNYDNNEKATI
ncbi:hypothetical protein [Burkholderia lata]|uniref:hypothetical protein n=1 Tax=Burkholderia lata (strain ATCC 17760 / DSM 23089 / LMG 22485 / NCIMB 9086 / R18194 / 383) TaxID=482957 RepID=UPI00158344D7|nr:hypothetical protein [Burkholderia lata]